MSIERGIKTANRSETVDIDKGLTRLSFALLGGFALRNGDKPMEIRNRKAQVLLAYLSLSPTHCHAREHLAGLLWSEFPESRARASLRQLLRHLRQVFDDSAAPGLTINRTEICLDSALFESDISMVLDSVDQIDPHSLLLHRKLLPETLLAGYEDIDPSVRSWLIVQRQSLHERLVFALESQLAKVPKPVPLSQRQTVKSLAHALSNLDATHEGACRRLMMICVQEGDTAGALRHYKNLWDLLDDEYDMEPSTETQNLVAQIKTGELETEFQIAPVADSVPSVIAPVSIAAAGNSEDRRLQLIIDPFEESGISPDRRYLVSGFRHQLISDLIRFREWSIIGGSLNEGVSANSDQNHTRYRVRATSYETGDQIYLVLTLSDQSTNEYVWSEDYSADLQRWFEIQRLVVRRMAVALNVQLSADRIRRIVGKPDVSLPVYDRWLKGEVLAHLWRPEPREQAAEIFRSIIDDEPGFAPAYCSLVNFANSRHHIFAGQFRSPEREQESLALAKTAVNIDPTNSRAHLCAAWCYAINQQFDQAELSFQMAYELNENDPWTLVSSTLGLSFCNRQDVALPRANQALELGLTVEPRHWGYQAVIRFLCEDYEGCVQAAERSQDVIYNFAAWKAAALVQLGYLSEARSEWCRFVEMVRADWRGEREASDHVISKWLLDAFPIRAKKDRKRFSDSLSAAGASIRHTGAGGL